MYSTELQTVYVPQPWPMAALASPQTHVHTVQQQSRDVVFPHAVLRRRVNTHRRVRVSTFGQEVANGHN